MGKKPVDVYVCIKCGKEENHHRSTCPRCGSTMIRRTKMVETNQEENPKL